MLPILPIIMAVASVAGGVASGISAVQSAKAQAKAVQKQTQTQINERAKQARKLMSQQKTSFLKGGVFFNGTPTDVINETYNTSVEDINAMRNDANATIRGLRRQANGAFWTSAAKGIANGALSYVGAGGLTSMAGDTVTTVNSANALGRFSAIRRFGNLGSFTNASGNIISPVGNEFV